MRTLSIFAGALALAASATAAIAADLPAGWSRDSEGNYVHDDSGVVCRPAMEEFTFLRLDGPANSNILGTCVYSGGPARVGEIQVRKFVDGVGESEVAIANDRKLMSVSALPMHLSETSRAADAYRSGPGPIVDGKFTIQFVTTSAHRRLLVDCIVQTQPDDAERDVGKHFTQACKRLGGH